MKEYFDGQLTQRGGTEEMALLCTRYVLSVISVRYFTGVFHVRGAPRLKIENDPFNILAQIFEEIEQHPLISWSSHEADVKYKKYIENRIEFYKNRKNNGEEKELLIVRLKFDSYFKESNKLTPSEDTSSRIAGVIDDYGFRVLVDHNNTN